MNDNYTVLPRSTQQLLFKLSNLYEKCNHDDYEYTQALLKMLDQPEYKNMSFFKNQIATLIRCNYIDGEEKLLPTDTGLHYKWLERRFICYRYLVPAVVSVIVSLITNYLIYLSKS